MSLLILVAVGCAIRDTPWLIAIDGEVVQPSTLMSSRSVMDGKTKFSEAETREGLQQLAEYLDAEVEVTCFEEHCLAVFPSVPANTLRTTLMGAGMGGFSGPTALADDAGGQVRMSYDADNLGPFAAEVVKLD